MSAVAAAVLCCKIVYAPLLAIGVPGICRPQRWLAARKAVLRSVVAQLLIAAFALGLAAVWLASAASTIAPWFPPAAAAAKEAAILRHPLRFILMLIIDMRRHGLFYITDAIGIFGAWTVPLPGFVYVTAGWSVLLSLFVDSCCAPRLEPVPILWNLALILGAIILVQTSMFLIATPVGTWELIGVQGRYFLPLGGLGAATLTSVRGRVVIRRHAGAAYALLLAVIVLNTVAMDATIITGFHLF